MIDNVKKAFSLEENADGKKLDKDQGSVWMFQFDLVLEFQCSGSQIPEKDKSENNSEEMILNSGIEEAKVLPSKRQISDRVKPSTKKGISTKVRDIRRVLIHVLCGSGMLKIELPLIRLSRPKN